MKEFNRSLLNKDYDQLKEWILEQIPQITTDWNDFVNSDLGTVYVGILAAVADQLALNTDFLFNEAFISTVSDRFNAQEILSLLDYKLKSYVAGQVNLRVDLTDQALNPATWSEDIVIPAYSQFTKEEDNQILTFTTTEDIVIKAGRNGAGEAPANSIPAYLGVPNTVTTLASDIDRSTNVFTLGPTTYAEGTVKVFLNSNTDTSYVEWNEVKNVELETTRANNFSIQVNQSGNTTIQLDPSITNQDFRDIETKWINAYTNITELAAGVTNISLPPDLITTSGLVDINGQATNLTLQVSATYRASGTSAETVDEARSNSVKNWRRGESVSSVEDYRQLINEHPLVYDSLIVDRHVKAYLNFDQNNKFDDLFDNTDIDNPTLPTKNYEVYAYLKMHDPQDLTDRTTFDQVVKDLYDRELIEVDDGTGTGNTTLEPAGPLTRDCAFYRRLQAGISYKTIDQYGVVPGSNEPALNRLEKRYHQIRLEYTEKEGEQILTTREEFQAKILEYTNKEVLNFNTDISFSRLYGELFRMDTAIEKLQLYYKENATDQTWTLWTQDLTTLPFQYLIFTEEQALITKRDDDVSDGTLD